MKQRMITALLFNIQIYQPNSLIRRAAVMLTYFADSGFQACSQAQLGLQPGIIRFKHQIGIVSI